MNAATTQDLRFGGFDILEVVAESARSTVYRATDGTRPIALKIYSDVFDTCARVEAAVLGKLRHPATARLVSAGPLDDRYMIATEWIDGAPLGHVSTWPEIRRIVTAIAAGLGAIHEAGNVHGELEPRNVIVRAGRPAATIIDFSHAVVTNWPATITGSPAYMSPEQAQGAPLDGRSDFYALGVILYELLCGELPFEGTPDEVLRSHLREPVISPRMRAPDRDIPKLAEDVCMWLLAKDRDARLPNARVLAITIAATEVSP
jgi:serine/threonine protein kinase